MAGVHFDIDNLYSLVKHHIALTGRFAKEYEKSFSLAFLMIEDKDRMQFEKEILAILRESDIVIAKNEKTILLLPSTDWNGAHRVLEGIYTFLASPLRDTIVTFPDDGTNAMEIVSAFENAIYRDFGEKI